MQRAVKALKTGKLAGIYTIPAKLVKEGGDAMIVIITGVFIKI